MSVVWAVGPQRTPLLYALERMQRREPADRIALLSKYGRTPEQRALIDAWRLDRFADLG
jgi:hypothetical protein